MTSLKIVSIFSTWHCEGQYSGCPAIFVRLGGCNLSCSFCDTDFDKYNSIELNDILLKISDLSKNREGKVTRKLVVITGGEPLKQDIVPFCEILYKAGYSIHIETNGSIFRNIPNYVYVVCSPKLVGGKPVISPAMIARADIIKFIISSSNKDYFDPTIVPHIAEVILQPMDEYCINKNNENIKHVLYLSELYGYRFSIQLHKILGIE